MKKLMLLLAASFFSYSSFAVSEGATVSIYNIANGVLAYSFYYNSSYGNIQSDTAYKLKGNWYNYANWKIIYLNSGEIALKNTVSNHCIQTVGDGYQAQEAICDFNNRKQILTPILASTGAIKLKFADTNSCLYSYAGNSNYYIYADHCGSGSEYLWSLIPPLLSSSY